MKSYLLNVSMTTIGAGIRYFAFRNYSLVLIAQAFMPSYGAFGAFCLRWLEEDEANVAMAIMTISMNTGMSLGYIIPPLFIDVVKRPIECVNLILFCLAFISLTI